MNAALTSSVVLNVGEEGGEGGERGEGEGGEGDGGEGQKDSNSPVSLRHHVSLKFPFARSLKLSRPQLFSFHFGDKKLGWI